MKIISILLLFLSLSINLLSQDFKSIDTDIEIQEIYYNLILKEQLNYTYFEDFYSLEIIRFKITNDSICLNNYCSKITSPIFSLKGKINPDEINFFFKFDGGFICILFYNRKVVNSIEIFNPPIDIFLQFINITLDQ